MKNYKGIIFDFDMTLADTASVIITLLNQVAEEFGYPAMEPHKVLPAVGYGHEIMLSHVTGEKEKEKLHRMGERYRQVCRERMPDMMEYFPDVPDSLRRLKERGLVLGVLSQKPRDALTGSLEKYDLRKYIDVVTGCEDAPAHKPDPGGLLISAKAMGLLKEQIIFIGDHLVDQETARGAHMDFAAMVRETTKKEEFDPEFVKGFYGTVGEAVRDLCGPDVFALVRKG
ncbi:MAG: HAD family hydrolase [Hungatella sp.]|nr:HAD family hydrolase [Hungatella sp.]